MVPGQWIGDEVWLWFGEVEMLCSRWMPVNPTACGISTIEPAAPRIRRRRIGALFSCKVLVYLFDKDDKSVSVQTVGTYAESLASDS